MSQDSDFKTKSLQRKSGKLLHSQITTSHLKLVVSNSVPTPDIPVSSRPASSNSGFTAKVKKRGVDFYEMNIQDPFHDLECDLILEVERNDSGTTIACHFPSILDEPHQFLNENETLYGIVMLQFQMKVLEQLFLFCATHGASYLAIYMDDDQAEGFGILQDFLIYCDETWTENGEKTEVLLSTDQEDFDKWRHFMEKTNLMLEQDLWCKQRSNPTIRRYLKSRPLLKAMKI